jgi:hypothetical protein
MGGRRDAHDRPWRASRPRRPRRLPARPRGTLEPDEQAPLVTELFKRRAAGESVSALTRWLQDTSLRTSHGGQATRRLVDGVLRNRVYLGEARSGELINRRPTRRSPTR